MKINSNANEETASVIDHRSAPQGTQNALFSEVAERVREAEFLCKTVGHHMTFEFILGKGQFPTVRIPLNNKAEAELIMRVLKRERQGLGSNPKDEYKVAELIEWHKAVAKWVLGISEDEACCWKVIAVDGKVPQ